MITELLAGFLVSDLFFKTNHVPSKPQVLGEIRVQQTPEPSRYKIPINLEKPSPKPSVSKKPQATLKPQASSGPRGSQASAINTQSVLQALNDYRSKNGAGTLKLDSKLQDYAQSRANYLNSLGKLDKHAGHQEFMKNGGFEKLGFNAVAENQSYNYKDHAQGLIESFYGKSSGHNKNQLNPEYTHVGIGISGAFTDIVFGGKKR